MPGRPFIPIEMDDFYTHSCFTFKVGPNNVFCTLEHFEGFKIKLLNSASSGKYKIPLSKKTLKHKAKFVILSFLKEIQSKNILLTDSLCIKLTAPVRLKKVVLKLLIPYLKNKNFVVEVLPKKVFNGCRSRKKIRKKRKGLRLFK
jgi:hypothetical protein|uniref:Ribosomal protein S11 n=1 Tax=Ochromonas danica TaxID=2986 RepID=Q9G905_OCHDN|nr:ribosomal protein S11 [Ochromonas danica]AAG18400.1 ribosomal protein S11 [Ochromonas danica]